MGGIFRELLHTRTPEETVLFVTRRTFTFANEFARSNVRECARIALHQRRSVISSPSSASANVLWLFRRLFKRKNPFLRIMVVSRYYARTCGHRVARELTYDRIRCTCPTCNSLNNVLSVSPPRSSSSARARASFPSFLPLAQPLVDFPPCERFVRELITCYTLRRVENVSF